MSSAMKMSKNLCLLILFCLYCTPLLTQGSNQNERKPYIVYMGELPAARTYAREDHHQNLLATVIGDPQLARESKIHSYGKSFNGFVARLLPHEADKLLEDDDVVSVFPNTLNKLHTTRSWDFLGLPLEAKRQPNIESNTIVGVLDTGISLDCPSFNDSGYGPPPRTWKGKCVTGANFTGCNNKVIGAKYFNLLAGPGTNSPVDDDGHGSHTASTVAGVAVKGASLFGVGEGIARGGVPGARIAVYKVCWDEGCSDVNILAAFDEAIADGVNLISVSLGGIIRDFFVDSIAIGSFHAMKRGILTSCSAGNKGPSLASVLNVAPWILTVAASSIDRHFTTTLTLGDGTNISGISINTFSTEKKWYPLISGTASNGFTCDYDKLTNETVRGRIVYCPDLRYNDYLIKSLGGAGTIVGFPSKLDFSTPTLIPAVLVDRYNTGKTIQSYINSNKKPQAVIHKTTNTTIPAPVVASFSARGPQTITLKILKPDLIVPGVEILAGYSKLATITGRPNDDRHSTFNILSGTSMACPHATAAAAYVKSFHPDWSPASIKSALMTTATPLKIKDHAGELGFGSGQINPVKALDPGLVYNISADSYIAFLCKEGYNSTSIGAIIGTKGFNCSSIASPQGADGINYPSMHIQIPPANSSVSAIFYRNVTNVGSSNSTYKAIVTAPKDLSIKVIPDTLKFSGLNQQLSFKVVMEGSQVPKGEWILSASLEWNDSKYSVRSPIVIYRQTSSQVHAYHI